METIIDYTVFYMMSLCMVLSLTYLLIEGKRLVMPIISRKHRWFNQYAEDPRMTTLYRLCMVTFNISIGLIFMKFIYWIG